MTQGELFAPMRPHAEDILQLQLELVQSVPKLTRKALSSRSSSIARISPVPVITRAPTMSSAKRPSSRLYPCVPVIAAPTRVWLPELPAQRSAKPRASRWSHKAWTVTPAPIVIVGPFSSLDT